MEIQRDMIDGKCRLRFEGEMTIYAANEIKTELLTSLVQCAELEIGLAGVTEIDTVGMQLLMQAKREAEGMGKRLSLADHSQAVLDLIELYNLAGCFGDPLVYPASRKAA